MLFHWCWLAALQLLVAAVFNKKILLITYLIGTSVRILWGREFQSHGPADRGEYRIWKERIPCKWNKLLRGKYDPDDICWHRGKTPRYISNSVNPGSERNKNVISPLQCDALLIWTLPCTQLITSVHEKTFPARCLQRPSDVDSKTSRISSGENTELSTKNWDISPTKLSWALNPPPMTSWSWPVPHWTPHWILNYKHYWKQLAS